MRRSLLPAFFLTLLTGTAPGADDHERLPVGIQPDGRIVVPTNQILQPAGTQVTFPGRPVDLAWADSHTLVAKNMSSLVFLDAATGTIRQTLAQPRPTGGNAAGFSVVGILAEDGRLHVTDAKNAVNVAERGTDGKWGWGKSLTLAAPAVKGAAHPAGLLRGADGSLFVTSTRGNSVQRFAPGGGPPEVIPVGVAPYTLLRVGERLYVSNWGGDPPKPGDPQAKTSDTPVRVDPVTGVPNHGSVSVLRHADGKWQQGKTITVGLHPCALLASRGGRFVYVANANSDTISVLSAQTDEVVETIACRPEARLPFGSGPNALALSPDGGTLYVANGTNNCVAVVRLAADSSEGGGSRPARSVVAGQIPTGWFPGSLLLSPDGKRLYVANVKGHGSLGPPRKAGAKGKNSHDHLGSVSLIDVPNDAELARLTERVNVNNRLAYSLAGLEKPRPGTKPVPLPRRHGEPSVFKHVIYVIKENRTYDQVYGDMPEGNGDANLALFGEEVTPNHHALARQFTLLDNFYCSGVLSADGHTWANDAIVTDYLEKSFGGFTRSYPDDGTDPLAYAATGSLWANALRGAKTLRNYGEYVKNQYPRDATWTDFYNDYKGGGGKLKVKVEATMKPLQPHTHPGYPWFPLLMPDVYRAKLFIDELKEFEKKGEWPQLMYATLPCDHTDGTRPNYPTPRAMVADNDLALGQLVEAVSKSRFWPHTCIFVVEDDPQDGFDHVDAHRTVALAISPYTRRKHVDHTTYNQTGMVKSIELILGLPPMNQLDLSATPMHGCFQEQADLTPYVCVPNRVPLDEMNLPLPKLKGMALHWAKKSLEMNLDEGDEADEDTLNRILWFAMRGEKPYPVEHTRAGRGE